MQLRCATRSGRAFPLMKRQVDPRGRDAGRATASNSASIGCPFEADSAAQGPRPVATRSCRVRTLSHEKQNCPTKPVGADLAQRVSGAKFTVPPQLLATIGRIDSSNFSESD